MEKIAIVINGKGGAGKDTLCAVLAAHYKTVNISSITPIKEIASRYGWQGEKDAASRKFLSDLKRAFSDYNDLPNKYAISEYNVFLESDNEIFVVHIREAAQIKRFIAAASGNVVTLLVTLPQFSPRLQAALGNESDDMVDDFTYDFYYCNDKPLENIEADFLNFFKIEVLGKNNNA